MALPSVLKARRRQLQRNSASSVKFEKASDSRGLATPFQIKQSTKARRVFISIASFAYLISVVFLILVVIGNTSDKPVIRDTYFFKLDLSNIIPQSVSNAELINSIARSIGLHDFYQVGLWNFCEGYNNVGITNCSKPKSLYWFNPVDILLSELLAGATIALPQEVIEILNILRITSNLMFGFFMTGLVVSFVLIFVSPLVVISRWWSFPISVVACINWLLILAASIIASVISYVFKYAAEAQSDLNIRADVDVTMLVFMWVATGSAIIAFALHSGMCCCCASRRDIRTGRKPVRTSSPETSVTS